MLPVRAYAWLSCVYRHRWQRLLVDRDWWLSRRVDRDRWQRLLVDVTGYRYRRQCLVVNVIGYMGRHLLRLPVAWSGYCHSQWLYGHKALIQHGCLRELLHSRWWEVVLSGIWKGHIHVRLVKHNFSAPSSILADKTCSPVAYLDELSPIMTQSWL